MTAREKHAEHPTPLLDFTLCTFGGIISAALVIELHYLLYSNTGISFYTYMVWGLFPAGAFGMGLVAAAGYYAGAVFAHYMPTPRLLVSMMILAALTQLFIYLIEYKISAPFGMTFIEYMDDYMTSAVYRSGDDDFTNSWSDGWEVGNWGYGISFLQLIGFMAGGVACYYFLKTNPSCEGCQKFYRSRGNVIQRFATTPEFEQYGRLVMEHPMFSPSYMEMITQKSGKGGIKKGAIMCHFDLLECPSCLAQVLRRRVEMASNDGWEDLPEMTTMDIVPEDLCIKEYFTKKKQKRAV